MKPAEYELRYEVITMPELAPGRSLIRLTQSGAEPVEAGADILEISLAEQNRGVFILK
jgi:hypothetical protein